MVKKSFTEFRCGRTSTETIPSPGRPNETNTPEMINNIYDIVLNNPKVKVREITEMVSISTKRVVNTCDDGWNIDPPLYSGITLWVKTVG